MNIKNPVWEIMISDLTIVEPTTPVYALQDLFRGRSIHHLPVINKEGELLGIISSEDIKRIYQFNSSPETIQAKNIMTVSTTHVTPDTSIKNAIEILLENKFRALPVVDKNGILVGIVSSYDIMKWVYSSFAGVDEKQFFEKS